MQSPYGCDPQPNLDPIAWYCHDSDATTHPVASKLANAWGLYDMLGNVWEWNWDSYQSVLSDSTDPLGPASGTDRLVRGGSWYYGDGAGFARAAGRYILPVEYQDNFLGFRLARTAPP